jgi:hypothetical protein
MCHKVLSIFIFSFGVSLHITGQSLDSLFNSTILRMRVENIIDSAKIELFNRVNNAEYSTKKIDTAQFKYIPVINTSISLTSNCTPNKLMLSEILLIDKKLNEIVGSFHFGPNGNIPTCVNQKYFMAFMPPREENRLHYIPQECYTSLTNLIKKENSDYRLFSVCDTKSSYIIRKRKEPWINHPKEYPELICN